MQGTSLRNWRALFLLLFVATACGDDSRSPDVGVDVLDDGGTDADAMMDGGGDAEVDAPMVDSNPEPSCTDGFRNQDETGVDCGGMTCEGCGEGQRCGVATDCASNICIAGYCRAPSCNDGVRNGDETDLDCGGSCSTPCAEGAGCMNNDDCVMNTTCSNNVCSPANCTDGVLNGVETDVDCGGTQCGPCASGAMCVLARDCMTNDCVNNVCLSADCQNGTLDPGEVNVDCGGPNCAGCADGQMCNMPNDCGSGRCEGSVCTSCEDGIQNGGEIEIDCGGPCGGCAIGRSCTADADCITRFCDTTSNTCQAQHTDCLALLRHDSTAPSGTYAILPDSAGMPVEVYCEMGTNGGGWTLVGSSTSPLVDLGTAYYSDLATLQPSMANPGVWNGLTNVVAEGALMDVRFACRTAPSMSQFGVDMSFFATDWYQEMVAGPRDADTCFSSTGDFIRDPARMDNLTSMSLPAGTAYPRTLRFEDSCGSMDDFSVDLDAGGMDRTSTTDWGENDGTDLCSTTGAGGPWFIFARPNSCSNGILDLGELFVDCGGTCPACQDGSMCNMPSDCASNMCENGTCISCSDGMRNGSETDVDCGGSDCSACGDSLMCSAPTDCTSMRCESGTCTSCVDGIQNGMETAIDCGGDCALCPGGSPCNSPSECASGMCVNNICEAQPILYESDFEADNGGLIVSGDALWEWGVPNNAPLTTAHSGMNVWMTDLDADYPNRTDAYLELPAMNFASQAGDPNIEFWYMAETETRYDEVIVQTSIDGGMNWNQVTMGDLWPANSKFEGDVLTWTLARGSLVGTAGQVDVRVRFAFNSDISSVDAGVAIDDVRVLAPAADLSVEIIPSLNICNGADIVVTNIGSLPVNGFDLETTVNGSTSTETITMRLGPGESIIRSFTGTSFSATATAPGDSDMSNDSASGTGSASITLTSNYTELFESGAGGWAATGMNSSWALGMPSDFDINSADSGMNAWVTNLSRDYNDNELSYLISPCFDLSGASTDPLFFHSQLFRLPTSGTDIFWVEISLDGGANWSKLGSALSSGAMNWYNDLATNSWDGDSSSSRGAWRSARHLLDGAAGQSDVRIRFVFQSDGSGTDEGVAIDDVGIGL